MILLTIVLLTVITRMIVIGAIVLTGGVASVVAFGDIIVCVIAAAWIIKTLKKRMR